MSKEYIEREAFRKQLIDRQITTQFFNPIERHEIGCIIEMLDNTPAADVVEVRHGHFENIIAVKGSGCIGYCSECYTEHTASNPIALMSGYLYCRWCGAKMDGERKDEG